METNWKGRKNLGDNEKERKKERKKGEESEKHRKRQSMRKKGKIINGVQRNGLKRVNRNIGVS